LGAAIQHHEIEWNSCKRRPKVLAAVTNLTHRNAKNRIFPEIVVNTLAPAYHGCDSFRWGPQGFSA
jgi:hypothetical protein